ncbi:hypothetical protein TW95_gp0883 [Pandoravirus inopinatum]|uniref:Uncharacterized protein n=1 Tax=Pandoravirus inopinatum TaxID=1605721 RepID=A0A0B5JD58_9VIRU|nr:hypothetical protein TW95_gp0883 [Pandoravirus inopinatum]AJF97617.1 hypothetical protein [Pandoravirus inopinatum]
MAPHDPALCRHHRANYGDNQCDIAVITARLADVSTPARLTAVSCTPFCVVPSDIRPWFVMPDEDQTGDSSIAGSGGPSSARHTARTNPRMHIEWLSGRPWWWG